MSIFQEITVTWEGEEYEVAPDNVMRLIEKIEDHVRIADLISEKGPKMTSLAAAYGTLLRYVGVRVSDEEVYQRFFQSDAGQSASMMIANILAMMVPPSTHTPAKAAQGSKKKTSAK